MVLLDVFFTLLHARISRGTTGTIEQPTSDVWPGVLVYLNI